MVSMVQKSLSLHIQRPTDNLIKHNALSTVFTNVKTLPYPHVDIFWVKVSKFILIMYILYMIYKCKYFKAAGNTFWLNIVLIWLKGGEAKP